MSCDLVALSQLQNYLEDIEASKQRLYHLILNLAKHIGHLSICSEHLPHALHRFKVGSISCAHLISKSLHNKMSNFKTKERKGNNVLLQRQPMVNTSPCWFGWCARFCEIENNIFANGFKKLSI
jgi:hypothetical protein